MEASIYFEAEDMAGKSSPVSSSETSEKKIILWNSLGYSKVPAKLHLRSRRCGGGYLASTGHGSPLAPQCILPLTKLFHYFSDQFKNIAVAVDVIHNISSRQRSAY